MAKKNLPPSPPEPPRLRTPHQDAEAKLRSRVDNGRELDAKPINSHEELAVARRDYRKWDDYNKELLRQLFTGTEITDQYGRYAGLIVLSMRGRSLSEEIAEFHEEIESKIHRLESLVGRLELIPLSEEVVVRLESLPASKPHTSNKVFIVHGHDESIREAVARFVEKLGFEVVVLHEQANEGMTVIEKLEHHCDVGFAIILLTPDDEGRKVSTVPSPLHARARQNVVLELGYFSAKLGRRRVCALYKGGVELPSDFLGVLYVPLDDGGWQLRLAKELRAAGFPVDMNRAI
jgi:predicted nucleotide-binding protein